jgi:putative resolvase
MKKQSTPIENTTPKCKFQTSKLIRKRYAVCTRTLQRWDKTGKVKTIRTPTNKRLYDAERIAELMGDESWNATECVDENNYDIERAKKSIGYARVSGYAQKEDLERQVADLKVVYPDHRIITDIGSGLNYNRKGLRTLVREVCKGSVEEVVVMHKDRLCRYGVELLELIFKEFGTNLVVHDRASEKSEVSGGKNQEGSSMCELADDLIAITTFFVARHHGKRGAEKAKERKRRKEQELAILQQDEVPAIAQTGTWLRCNEGEKEGSSKSQKDTEEGEKENGNERGSKKDSANSLIPNN